MLFQMISKVSECGFESFERVAGSKSSNLEAIPAVSLVSGPPQSACHSVISSFFGMEYPCDSGSGSSNPKVVDNVK